MPNSEKSEMLTVYDKQLNPIGEKTRAEVHANGLLHQTIRLWCIHNDKIWFQQRSMSKTLFPGRLDLAATGHIDSGETPKHAALRETAEEIGLNLKSSDLTNIGAIPFPFMRPDGKLDNEFANIYLYIPDKIPAFKTSDEVAGLAAISLRDYEWILKTNIPITAEVYKCDPSGQNQPIQTGTKMFGHDDFCCLNKQEWALVKTAVENHKDKQKQIRAEISGIDTDKDTDILSGLDIR